ncbi:MAG: hypothetical protein JNJ83_16215 [Verrucomicrobiaceae bacterium]|nr:hypothetical protein [Verrucomicrobiaceae bacterium]
MIFRLFLAALGAVVLLTSCGTTGGSANASALMAARDAQIAMEPPGDYWIGRRFHIERTHLWGYVRRPRQSWDKARLVVLSERFSRQPDRFAESETADQRYGYDHNTEYRIWGDFSGRRVYDPNSNLVLPEFYIRNYEVINTSPGFLFRPGERFTGNQLLRVEEGADP